MRMAYRSEGAAILDSAVFVTDWQEQSSGRVGSLPDATAPHLLLNYE